MVDKTLSLISAARDLLARDEGVRRHPYDDKTGKRIRVKGNVTIGIGRNLDANPLSDAEIGAMFAADYGRALKACEQIYGPELFWGIELARQLALLSMAFQMGEAGLRGFVDMNPAVCSRDWESAARHAEDSDWATSKDRGTPDRARRVIRMLRTGLMEDV